MAAQAEDDQPNFPVHLVAKDLGELLDAAAHLGADAPMIDTAATVFAAGAAGPARELDIAGIASRHR